jgi:release factor glutamine methyltransferase
MTGDTTSQTQLYDFFNPMLQRLRTSHFIIRRLFGVKIPPHLEVQYDPTTILLSMAVKEICQGQNCRCLELGIGQAALVSLSLGLRQPVEIHGVDLSPLRVEQSRRVAQFNGIKANFFESDLFDGIAAKEHFDVIFFNPPYVPTQQGKDLRFTQRWRIDHDRVWDGGTDGTEVIQKFLQQAAEHLSDHGQLLFGVQNIFVPEPRIEAIIQASPLQLQSRFQRRLIPSRVYILGKRA